MTAGLGGRRLARNTLYNLLGQGLPLVVGVWAIPVTFHALGAARFGLLGLAWTMLGYVGVVDLGLGRATTKFVAQYLAAGETERASHTGTIALLSQVGIGIAGGAVLALASAALASPALGVPPALQAEAREMILMLGLAVPFVVLSAGLRGLLEAAHRFDVVNLIRVPTSAAVLLVPAISAPLGATLSTMVLLLLLVRVGASVASAVAVRRVVPGFRWRVAPRWAALRPLLSYGGWISVSNVLSPLLAYLERFVLAALAGVAAVGYYTAPAEMLNRLLIIPGALSAALFPAVSADTGADQERLLGRPSRFLLLALAPFVAALIVSAAPLLEVWLGRDYAARSTGAFVILAVGVLINGMAHIPYTYLLGRGRPDIPAGFHLLELPLFVVAAWLLVDRLGVAGAALAWTLRVTVDAALLTGAVTRVARLPVARLLGSRGGRAVLAVFGLAVAGSVGLVVTPLGSPRFALAAGLVALFGVAAWRFVLDGAERAALGGVFR